MKKGKLLAAVAVGLLAVAALGGVALAQTEDSEAGEKATFAARLAEKLGLTEAQVQTAIDEVREERKAERLAAWQEKYNARLDMLVEKGVVTEEQAAEIRSKMEAQSDLEIDVPGFGKREGFGYGHSRGKGWAIGPKGKFGGGKGWRIWDSRDGNGLVEAAPTGNPA